MKKNEVENKINMSTDENLKKATSEKFTHESDNKIQYEMRKSKSGNVHYKLKLILRNSIETRESSPDKSQKLSVWRKLRNKVSNFKNKLKYNTLTTNSFLDFYQFLVIRIFDKVYVTKEDLEKYCHELYHIICFSYRSEIYPIINTKTNVQYTSDCGWGCMIRSGQMMLARGIQKIKLAEFNFNEKIFKETSNIDVARDVILLFMDVPLKFEEVNDNQNILKMVDNVIEDLEKLTVSDKKYDVVKSVFPPFSIQNICKVGELMEKFPGEYFSDVAVVNIFQQLNTELNPLKNLEIVTFKEGVIFQDVILNSCFKLLDNQEDSSEVINLDGSYYSFDKCGVIFLSLRLGMDKLPHEYFESIKEIFKIPNNVGIIGGKSNDAHYFIGTADNFLIYIDPHLNQKSIPNLDDLQKNINSYLKKDVYQMHIKNLAPAFTIGFLFRSYFEYNQLISELKNYTSKKNSCFQFKDKQVININADALFFNDGDDF